ncbi:MAG: hypothetical protein IPO69_22175 [Saprospiraceae bacterium]|nr:hypothetical protein [Saprospiraceae bacterium]
MHGKRAALLEIILQNSVVEMTPSEKVNLHRVRAENLRALDRSAENRLAFLGEQFLPEDRLALKEALIELDKAMIEGSPAYYDPELWNLRSAWAYLMQQYEQTISFADHAIELRPIAYALPHLNKSFALWELKRKDQAMKCIQDALKQAEESKNESHLSKVKEALKNYTSYRQVTTLEALYPNLSSTLRGAGIVAEEEIADDRGNLKNVSKDLLKRVKIVGLNWSMNYVRILAELISFYSPEAASFIVAAAAEQEPSLIDNILNAALYLSAYSEGVMKNDAARFLALEIITPLEARSIRQTYRLGILEVSAAATDEMAQLDTLLRKQLLRMHSQLLPLLLIKKV